MRVAPPKVAAPMEGQLQGGKQVQKARFLTFWRGLPDLTIWDPRRVYMPRWRRQSLGPVRSAILLAIWRTIVGLYLFGIIVSSWVRDSRPGLWPAFLTNWGLTSTCLHFVFSAGVGWAVLLSYRRQKQTDHVSASADSAAAGGRPTYVINIKRSLSLAAFRGALIVFELATTLETLIVILYWSLLYNQAAADAPLVSRVINVSAHGVPASVLWIDLMLGCHRPIDAHAFLLFAVGCVYMVVNYAGTVASGSPLYSVLTWQGGSTAVLLLGALAGIFLAFFFVSTAAFWRDRLARKGWGCCSFSRGPAASPSLSSRSAASAASGGLGGGVSYIDESALLGGVPGAPGGFYGAGDEDDLSDYDHDEDAEEMELHWFGGGGGRSEEWLAKRFGMQDNGDLPAFAGPRFADTRKAYPCAMCQKNVCSGSSGGAGAAGVAGGSGAGASLLVDGTGMGREFGYADDNQSDSMYPI